MEEVRYFIYKYKKSFIILVTILILIIIALSIIRWITELNQRQGKLAVPINIVPSSAEIQIDSQPINTHKGEIFVTPGDHKIKVSNPGFTTYENSFSAYEWNIPGQYIGLSPESDDAKKWYSKNPRLYKELEQAAYQESVEYGKKFNERWPITKILPIKDPYFTISYRPVKQTGDIYLTIKGTSPRYRMFAIDHLRKQGFEPTDYNIEFIGFKNPLNIKEGNYEQSN
jgi:hypothetical protein